MLSTIREFVKIVSETVNLPEPIYEFGSYTVPGQEKLADLRPFFSGKKYIGCDMRPGPGVDIVLDIHSIALPSEIAGSVLSFETFEHIEYPRKAIEEIYRILKPGGMIAISSLMKFPIHNHPHDYWRFTPEGFKSLLKKFNKVHVYSIGEKDFPVSIVGIGFKGKAPFLEKFKYRAKRWQRSNNNIVDCLQKARRVDK